LESSAWHLVNDSAWATAFVGVLLRDTYGHDEAGGVENELFDTTFDITLGG
jgi:hypothetical protein